jgi:hypothetical protein
VHFKLACATIAIDHQMEMIQVKVGEIIIDETPIRKRVQDLTITNWTIIKEEQVTKVNMGTKENVQQVKMSVLTDCYKTID